MIPDLKIKPTCALIVLWKDLPADSSFEADELGEFQ